MNRKILIFGYSRIAKDVMKKLKQMNYAFTVVVKTEKDLFKIQNNGFEGVAIDSFEDKELKLIGISTVTKTIFSFFDKDEDNIFLTISARALDPSLEIISLVSNSQNGKKLLTAGATKVIDQFELSAQRVVNLIEKPDITAILDNTIFGNEDIEIAQIILPKDSFLDNKNLHDVNLNQEYDLIVLGIVDIEYSQDLIFTTSDKKHILNSGDILVVIGKKNEIEKLKKDLKLNLMQKTYQ